MKTKQLDPQIHVRRQSLGHFVLAPVLLSFLAAACPMQAAVQAAKGDPSPGPTPQSPPLRWVEIGARAGADYHGDGLSVTPADSGARLRCAFQRLEAEATREGLWLTSTVTNAARDRFCVRATEVGRIEHGAPERPSVKTRSSAPRSDALRLPETGTVTRDGQTVRLLRPGLIEEYSASVDGVRQDFVIEKRPEGTGELLVTLAVDGARPEAVAPVRYAGQFDNAEPRISLSHGAVLVLENSRRKLAYSRLRVTDAKGRELPARMEASKNAECRTQNAEFDLAVVVDDLNAVYPVRIDPTFSDANWISMNPNTPGADDSVTAAVVDGSGNLYIAGRFKVAVGVFANGIAKWDGSSWSALGSGMIGGEVRALAVSGTNVYAGGFFFTAGGSPANYIAKWNGSSWSALGSGMNNAVLALAVSGSDLYAGGTFTTAGGNAAKYIAKWNGSSWSALGSGINNAVNALAVSGSDLYAGGYFTTAGGGAAYYIAKWNGSSWSALGSGMNNGVWALAVSGSDLYAGGSFTTAGGSAANRIAKWNGSSWSALGSGLDNPVYALAVSGSDLYAGGGFTAAGGSAANYIAKWDGSSWSALGSGMGGGYSSPFVYALAVSGSDLYAGGIFKAAGGVGAYYIAKWNGSSWSALGSGLGDDSWIAYVNALAVSGSDLYAGGKFTTAGGRAPVGFLS